MSVVYTIWLVNLNQLTEHEEKQHTYISNVHVLCQRGQGYMQLNRATELKHR